MGPTWYGLPSVFEKYFNNLDKSVSDYYNQKNLDPAYRWNFGKSDFIGFKVNLQKISKTFEEFRKVHQKTL